MCVFFKRASDFGPISGSYDISLFRRHIGGLDTSASSIAGSGDAEKALVEEWLQFASSMKVGQEREGEMETRRALEGERGKR